MVRRRRMTVPARRLLCAGSQSPPGCHRNMPPLTGTRQMAATDFFRRQEQARRSTLWLRVLFAVAMLAAAAAMSLTLLVLGNVLLHGMLFNLHNGNFWHAAFIASHGGWYVVLALAGTCL